MRKSSNNHKFSKQLLAEMLLSYVTQVK